MERVSAEANDMDFVSRSFVDTALPVASVSYVADLPRKHRREKADAPLAGQHVTEPQLDALIAGAQKEVILQTPYLVLSKPAQKLFRELRKRPQPPRVVVSSNSLAATDNPIVYALSYKYKRRNMRELASTSSNTSRSRWMHRSITATCCPTRSPRRKATTTAGATR